MAVATGTTPVSTHPLPFVKNVIFGTNDEGSEKNLVVLFPLSIDLGHVRIRSFQIDLSI